MKLLKVLCLILVSFTVTSYSFDEVVYGNDDRKDLNEEMPNEWREWAAATAAMIHERKILKQEDGSFSISRSDLLGDAICKGERFLNQPTTAFCSGFLIDKDILVTSNFCVGGGQYCGSTSYRWVFNYSVKAGFNDVDEISDISVFKCKEVISYSSGKSDYAVIRLDRGVEGVKPLKFRKNERIKLKVGDKLVTIGHPSGLPTKVDGGGRVVKIQDEIFHANLDTFYGSSGSPVINQKTGLVEGIMSKGHQDYKYDSVNSCYRTNILNDDYNKIMESSTSITEVLGISKY